MVLLRDLLHAHGLGLRLRAAAGRTDHEVTGVSVIEYPDPGPWLSGGDLVLTAGRRQPDGRSQTAFVLRASGGGAAALGFKVGRDHRSVPKPTVAAAAAAALPLLEIPPTTSFEQIGRLVTDPAPATRYARLDWLLHAQQKLAADLHANPDVPALLDALHRLVHSPVAIVDLSGRMMAASPAEVDWPAGLVRQALAARPVPGDRGMATYPVHLDGGRYALLSAATGHLVPDLLRHAATLIGLELSRMQADRAGRRELVGQLIEALVRSEIPAAEARSRLVGFGIDPDAAHGVLLFTDGSDRPAARLARSATLLLSRDRDADSRRTVVAQIGPYAAVLMYPPQQIADLTRRLLAEHDDPTGGLAVGVGGPYSGLTGLRWAFVEAEEAVSAGPGLHRRHRLDLGRLLTSSPDLPVQELGREVLRPLMDFDAHHDSDLVRTLHTFLTLDCSTQATARALYVHRNTVRYRLGQIEQVTGRSLSSTQTRVHLWLALMASGATLVEP